MQCHTLGHVSTGQLLSTYYCSPTIYFYLKSLCSNMTVTATSDQSFRLVSEVHIALSHLRINSAASQKKLAKTSMIH